MKTEKQLRHNQKTMAALNVTICPNGDQYIRKKLVLNRKRIPNLEVLLDNATQLIGARNCVRLLRTPNHGTRIRNLDNMVDGGVYVAIVGPSDKLKKIEYNGTKKHFPRPPNSDGPRRRTKISVQARAFQEGLAEASRYRMIYVYRNGEDSGMKMLLDKRLLYSIDKVLQHISDKLKMNTAVRNIYDVEGHLIDNVPKIENNGTYVAVGYGQRFKKFSYNKQDIQATPRRPVASKFSGSTDSSIKKKIKHNRITTNVQSGNKDVVNKVNTSYDLNETREEEDTLFEKLNNVFDKEVEKIDDVVDNHLTSHNDDDVNAVSRDNAQNEVKPMSITPDRMVSPDEHVNEAMDVSPPISPRRSPISSSVKHDGSKDVEVAEAFKRDGTFDKEYASDHHPEQEKQTKKKSKASTFDKAISKTERSNTLDSNKSEKKQTRKPSIKNNEKIENEKITPKKSEKAAEPTKQRKKTKTETQKSIQEDSLNVKDNTTSNEQNIDQNDIISETPLAEGVQQDPSGTPPITERNETNADEDIIEEIEGENNERKISINSHDGNNSPTVFQASGEQSEKADVIKDNKDTKVEKTLDMMPAEIVEDEEIEIESETDNAKNDGKSTEKVKEKHDGNI